MRILLTGGTGFIGQALCPRLIDAGHELVIYSRQPERVTPMFGENATGIGDLGSVKHETFDAVINLAGESIAGGLWTKSRKQKLRDSRIALTNELCRNLAASENPPKVFISGSAVGVYGDGGDAVLTEDSPSHPEFAQTLCADWEAAADEASGFGARVVKLRIGLVMGQGGGFLAPLKLPFKLGLGARLGDGKQWMSWIARIDMARVIEFALDNDVDGAFNACSPNPVTNAEFTRSLTRALHRWQFPIPVPAFVLKIALGEMSRLLLTGQRAVPARLEGAGFRFEMPRLDATLEKAVR